MVGIPVWQWESETGVLGCVLGGGLPCPLAGKAPTSPLHTADTQAASQQHTHMLGHTHSQTGCEAPPQRGAPAQARIPGHS